MSHGSTAVEAGEVRLRGRADEGSLPRFCGASATAPVGAAEASPGDAWELAAARLPDKVSVGLPFVSPIPLRSGLPRPGSGDGMSRRRYARCGPTGRRNRKLFCCRIEPHGHPGSTGKVPSAMTMPDDALRTGRHPKY